MPGRTGLPMLAVNELTTQSETSEQKGFANLFADTATGTRERTQPLGIGL